MAGEGISGRVHVLIIPTHSGLTPCWEPPELYSMDIVHEGSDVLVMAQCTRRWVRSFPVRAAHPQMAVPPAISQDVRGGRALRLGTVERQ